MTNLLSHGNKTFCLPINAVSPTPIANTMSEHNERTTDKQRNPQRKQKNMKTQTNLTLAIYCSLSLALAVVIWFPVPLQAQEPAKGKVMTEANMMEHCLKMKEQKQKMMADMQAQDVELTEAVAKMNSAPEDKKMSLMAAVITRLVEQQTSMHTRMAKMQEEMMTHMMQHMQMGKDSMTQCPMMREMKGKDDKLGDVQKVRQIDN